MQGYLIHEVRGAQEGKTVPTLPLFPYAPNIWVPALGEADQGKQRWHESDLASPFQRLSAQLEGQTPQEEQTAPWDGP